MRRARFTRSGILALSEKAWGLEVDEAPAGDRGFAEEGDAAIVQIRGPLLAAGEGWLALFCDSYEAIEARARAAFASPARRVILRINSPGGDAAGCFELARSLRAMAVETGKSLVVYGEGLIASAAYALATAATGGIHVGLTCDVGSIGVFEVRADLTAMNAAAGVQLVFVSSGAEKLDRNPDTPVTEEAVARIQAHVDEFAGLFFALCAEQRGGSPEDFQAMRGGIYLGASAVGAGLADSVATWTEVLAGSVGAENSMATSAKNKGFDAAKDALRSIVDDEKASDEDKEIARKSLRAIEDGPKKDPDGDGDKDAAARKAEDDKKKDDEMAAAKSKAEEDERKEAAAKALSADNLALGRQVMELQAAESARRANEAQAKVDGERAALFARRPDLPKEMLATLQAAPIEILRNAVETWPRATASAGAAAAALTAGGADRGSKTAANHLTEAELELLSGGPPRPVYARATMTGSLHQMPVGITQAQAAARLVELDKELGR